MDEREEYFEVRMDYTREDLAAYWRALYWKKEGKEPNERKHSLQMVGSGIACLAGGIVLVVLGLLRPGALAGIGILSWVLTLVGGLLVIVSALLFASGQKQSKRWVEKAWAQYQAGGAKGSCRFTPRRFETKGSGSDTRYEYKALEALWEDEGHFYLYLSTYSALILSKSGFTQGEPGRFGAFLQEQTGKTIHRIGGAEA